MARPRKFDDVEVLDRAIDLFWRDGIESVSVRDLEASLELKAPSIYRRFTSKEHLIEESLERYTDRSVGGRIRHFLESADDPLDGLRSFFTSALDHHPGEPTPRGCLLTTTAGQPNATSPGAQQTVIRGFDTIEVAFCRQLERAQLAGQLRSDADPEALAKILLVSFQGLLVLARSGRSGLFATIDATLDALIPRSR